MKTITLEKNPTYKRLVKAAAKEQIILSEHGHAVAMVVPIDDDEMEWMKIENSPEFIESIRTARSQVKRGQTMSHEAMKKKFGIK